MLLQEQNINFPILSLYQIYIKYLVFHHIQESTLHETKTGTVPVIQAQQNKQTTMLKKKAKLKILEIVEKRKPHISDKTFLLSMTEMQFSFLFSQGNHSQPKWKHCYKAIMPILKDNASLSIKL